MYDVWVGYVAICMVYGMVYIAAFNETYHYGSICLEKKKRRTRDMSSTFVFERLARYIFQSTRLCSIYPGLSLFVLEEKPPWQRY
jgi:hypothetical protein